MRVTKVRRIVLSLLLSALLLIGVDSAWGANKHKKVETLHPSEIKAALNDLIEEFQDEYGNDVTPVRTATLVVAASDSSAKSKAQADYVCDGTDDQVQIQAAIDALPSQGGKILLMEGTFTISSTINIITHQVCLEGLGWATRVQAKAGSAITMFELSGVECHYAQFINFQIHGNDVAVCGVHGTSDAHPVDSVFFRMLICHLDGYGIHYEKTEWHQTISECVIEFCDTAIYLEAGEGDITEDIVIVNNDLKIMDADGAFWIKLEGTVDHEFERVFISGNEIRGRMGGTIWLEYVERSIVSDNGIEGLTGAGNCYGIYLSNCVEVSVVDNAIKSISECGIKVEDSTYTTVSNNGFASTWLGDLWILNSPYTTIVGNRHGKSGNHHIRIENSDYFLVNSNSMESAGNREDNTFDCIYVYNSSNGIIATNRTGPHYIGNGSRYGINISDAGSVNNLVVSNEIIGTGETVNLNDAGTGTIVRGNYGYTTENSGTTTLLNGNTSIVVNHGLDVTPAAGDIMVTPIESLGVATEFYIDTYTATQFTIRVDVNPTQDVDFAWKAIVL